ncbi:hypothetical protein, partial [Oceanobacillus indicireducens]|uniref:hypothetical protein n=1 Tax=Oceanobacillus indicireducens TaxID=1004261 RepID=UPI00166CBE40
IDEARDDINRARSDLDIAQEELNQTKIDLNDSRERLEDAEDNLRNAREDLNQLESDLREAENSLRDKVDFVDFNERIADITRDMASKVDGEWVDGRLRVEIDGESELIYVKEDIDGMFENTVSKTKYETDQEGYVERFKDYETNIEQTWREINARLKSADYNADQNRLENRLAEWEATADGFKQSVSRLQTDLDGLEIGGRNLVLNSKTSLTTVNIGQWGHAGMLKVPIDGIKVSHGDTVTFSVYVSDIPSGESVYARLDWYRADGTYGNVTNSSGRRTTDGIIKITAKVPDDSSYVEVRGRIMPVGWTSVYPIKYMHDQLEKGNKATDWSPAPEDQITYTETRIEQLADKIALEYIKDDDLIAGIRIGDPNPINGANVEITGDTAIYGEITAPLATFIEISTKQMYAIDAEIKDSKITGKLDANEALFQKGKFDEAHLIKAKIEEADIIDADIQNATITGSLNSVGGTFTGRLEGVDGTFTGKLRGALIEGSEFISEEELGLTRRKTKVDVDGVTV